MNPQEWRGLIFRQGGLSMERFKCALLLNDVERWTIIPTLRPQSVAEHSFNVAIIADAFCEKLGLGRGSLIRMDAVRWALWHDADEIFTGDIPTPMKLQIPQHVMEATKKLSGAETNVEECGDSLSRQLVKLADLVEGCRFLNTWGVDPSRQSIVASLKDSIRTILNKNPNLAEIAVLASEFVIGGDITWWMKRLTKTPKSESPSLQRISLHIQQPSSSPSRTTRRMVHSPNSSPTSGRRGRKSKNSSTA